MKHFIAFIFVCFVAIGAFAQTSEQRLTGPTDSFTFTLIDNGTAYSVSKGTAITGEIIIPAYYRPDANSNYLPVTSIGLLAFSHCTSLTSIVIPASIIAIGESAFSDCSGLTGITIPASIISIGYNAFGGCGSLTTVTFAEGSQLQNIAGNTFSHCTRLTSISIPKSVTSIGSYVFRNCTSLATVTFAEDSLLQSIDSDAFYWCSSLTNIKIPNSVSSIGDGAFAVCSSLTSITIPESVTFIGVSPFINCRRLTSIAVVANNPNYTSEGGILYNKPKTTLIQAPNAIRGTFTIPTSVTSIGNSAFSGCNSLTSITIREGVTSIGVKSFDNCISLTVVTIPASVTSIGSSPFINCTRLTGITVSANNPNYTSEGGILYNKTKTTLIQAPMAGINDSVTIPATVTAIGDGAFNKCTNLSSITIPAGIATIGAEAFSFCSKLTYVIFATGSAITSENFGFVAFPQGNNTGGNNLRTAYLTGGAGTYTRAADGNTWTKQ